MLFSSLDDATSSNDNDWSCFIRRYRIWIGAVLIVTCCKILLIPSYRSTDFDVHRNWLALTRHVPLDQWYFHNNQGTTVHTLDYPPTFAFFEFLWSQNPVTDWLLSTQQLDHRCLDLLPDTDNTPSNACVVFQRTTVILSDTILYLGAALAATAVAGDTTCNNTKLFVFLIIVLHPGLWMLDHVHFQYNGMLLGILLISCACLVKGAAYSSNNTPSFLFHAYHLLGAFSYAILLTMKHLYLPLAPIYFIYLLKHYCFTKAKTSSNNNHENDDGTTTGGVRQQQISSTPLSFSLSNFMLLATITGTTLVLPFVPFVWVDGAGSQLWQIFQRLFPFQRGLVHDYWAANVWALYTLLSEKILPKLQALPQLPEITPAVSAACLLLGLLPTILILLTSANGRWPMQTQRQDCFLHAVILASLSAFMLAYHVHEKAIMTAIVLMTMVLNLANHAKIQADPQQDTGSGSGGSSTTLNNKRLFWRLNAFGIVGLFPLLFRPVELSFKIVAFLFFMVFLYQVLTNEGDDEHQSSSASSSASLLTWYDGWALGFLSFVVVFLEVIHPLFLFPRMEFLPLLLTSTLCAVGLIQCWIQAIYEWTLSQQYQSTPWTSSSSSK